MLIKCIDLFCGVGGLTHGLVSGGVHVVAGVDLDPQCRFAYEFNNCARFMELDIASISGSDLVPLVANADYTMLAGCAPCQPFSTYSRKGRTDRKCTEWDLVAEFGRVASEMKPDFVTMENVPQLLDHRVFKKFLCSLRDYRVTYKVIDCERFGIPQTRKRLVLLASRHGEVVLSPRQQPDSATVRSAISHLPHIAAGETCATDPLHTACRLSTLNLRRIRASVPGGTWRDWSRSLLAPCHRRASGATYPSVYGRMEWDAPAPTITTQCFGYGNGRFGHPEQDRAISLREAALLQTFPERYRFIETESPVRFSVLGRLIGNAVPVRLGAVVAESFVEHAHSLTLRSPPRQRGQRPVKSVMEQRSAGDALSTGRLVR